MKPSKIELDVISLTPALAVDLLERNKINRPLNQAHVERIAREITKGRWQFNGDTIKISDTEDVIDGQHRLWAVIEAQAAVETVVVRGVHKDAFSTVDTLRKPRSGADILALHGVVKYRDKVAHALAWMLRYQSGTVETMREPKNRIENADIEAAFENHPGMARAIERVMCIRRVANPALVGFFYYILANRNEELAERLVSTLEDPAGVGVNDPFFRLRAYFTADHHKHKDPIVTVALMIKAANSAWKNEKIQVLRWKNQGKSPEEFPKLIVK